MKPATDIIRALLDEPCPHPRGFAARINRNGCPDCLTAATQPYVERIAALEADLAAARERVAQLDHETEERCRRFDAAEAAAEALRVVLPMALGYAANNPVGSNERMIVEAQNAINAWRAVGGGK